MEEKRDTVGAISLDLMQKAPDSRDPIALQREMTEDYLDELTDTVRKNIDKFEGDFYVVVITKNEKLMPNVFRNYFLARATCPTPDYDQAVFQYVAKDEDIFFLWAIPTKEACIYLKENALFVVDEEKELLSMVLDFASGELYKLAKRLNGESHDSPLLTS